ncbi:MAG: hypothetical protein HON32_05135 [Francisellaceae bacterium]|jgi:hypothetical protein|nr:hypothetical protein [Francisellaceae bacterium]MBT6537965.1 hypothetical protein [Francisellaceae bacterium]
MYEKWVKVVIGIIILFCIPASLSGNESTIYRDKFLFITDLNQSTLGDLYATGKIIKKIIEFSSEHIDVSLIIRTDRNSNDPQLTEIFLQCCQKVNIFITQDWSETLLQDPELQEIVKDSQIVIFPAYDYLNRNNVLQILEKFKPSKPVILYSEYDFNISNLDEINNSWCCETGFGNPAGTGLGIFIENHIKPGDEYTKITQEQFTVDILNFLYLNEGEPDAENKTWEQLEIDYKKTHKVYFGYFNGIEHAENFYSNRNIINTKNFVLASIKKSFIDFKKNTQDKSVDILVPMKNNEFDEVVEYLGIKKTDILLNDFEVSRIREVSFYTRAAHENKSEVLTKRNSVIINPEGNFDIRILNVFPIRNQLFKFFVKHSDPFVGVTGDQSFSEGLSLSKLNAYQIMQWKEDMFDNFVSLCQFALGEESYISKFYLAHKADNSNDLTARFKNYLTILSDLFENHEEEMLIESTNLYMYLKKDMNLYQNFLGLIYNPILDINTKEMLKNNLEKHFQINKISNINNENELTEDFQKLFISLGSNYQKLSWDRQLQNIYSSILYYVYITPDENNVTILVNQFVNRIGCLILHPGKMQSGS